MSAVDKTFTRLAWIASALLGFSSLCGATPLFGFTVSGSVSFPCPKPHSNEFLIKSATTPVSDSTAISGTCPGPTPVSGSVEAAATAEAGGVSTSATSSGKGAGGGTGADYLDTFTLHPLPGFGPGVTFGVTASYTLTGIGGGSGGASGDSFIRMQIPKFLVDKEVFDFNGGTKTGLLDAGLLIFVKCPCVFTLELSAGAGAANGGSASASDPITIELPPGWTYTTASQAPLATPEPVGFLPVGGALLVLGQYLRRLGAGVTLTRLRRVA